MLYFAYGSNMSSRRMKARIASAKLVGPATLNNFIWCCNKLGRDGTAKANLMRQKGGRVLGVLYTVSADHLAELDLIEGGYQRLQVEVIHLGRLRTAHTYLSTLITGNPPSEAYLRHIVDGMLEQRLPREYVSEIRRESGI